MASILKIPVQLEKRLSDTVTSESRWEVHIPPDFQGLEDGLRGKRGQYFILMGPFDDEDEILKIIGSNNEK